MRSRAWATLSLTDDSGCSTVGIVSLLYGCILPAHRVVCEEVTVGLGLFSDQIITTMFSVWQVLRDTDFETVNDLLVRFWYQRQLRVILHGCFVSGFVDRIGAKPLQEGHNAFFLLPHDPLLLLWLLFQVLC